MSKSRRKTIVRIIEATALALVLLDVTLYFALVRPLRVMRTREEASYAAARERVRDLRVRAAQLEKYRTAVPEAERELADFLKEHLPSRRQGFSRAVRMVRELTDNSNLHLASVAYKLESSKEDPFERLAVDLDVEGPYANLIGFAHALETSSDLIVLRDFSIEPTEGQGLALRLVANLYLKP
ncbi:MAG: type 4a pilus biogenesis protein PilO [Terriglobia bacterium]